MPNLTLSVPHNLPRAEVKRRIQEQLTQAQQQFGNAIGPVEQRWTGDTLDVTAGPFGQRVSGRAVIEDKVVRVEIALPWMLGMLVSPLRQQIEQQGRHLLGHRPETRP
jgi:hypothetical protein